MVTGRIPCGLPAGGLIVRPLGPEDVAGYRSLMLEAYVLAADAFTATHEERVAEPMGWWEKRITDPKGLSIAFGAFREGTLAGAVALEFSGRTKTRHKAKVVGMYVTQALRGAGAGRALLRAAMAHARARRELRVLLLTVTEGNAGAVRLYESAGFQAFGVEPMAVCTGGQFRSKVHMQYIIR